MPQGVLATLRDQIRAIEGVRGRTSEGARVARRPVVSFGLSEIDQRFEGGGLPAGAHQAGGTEGDPVAPWSFGCAILSRLFADRPDARALIIQEAGAQREGGGIHAPGLMAFGLDPDRLALVEVRHGADALRVANEALKSRAVAAVLIELCDGAMLADLSVTRRFNLAACRAGALAIIVTPDLEGTSAALTRWRAGPAPNVDPKRRLGAPAFALSLTRNRLGPTGAWTVEWNSHDRRFRSAAPLSAPLARPAVDRPGLPQPGLPRLLAGHAPGAYRQAG